VLFQENKITNMPEW